MELKDYRRALNDISFCLRYSPAATNVRSFFREVSARGRYNGISMELYIHGFAAIMKVPFFILCIIFLSES